MQGFVNVMPRIDCEGILFKFVTDKEVGSVEGKPRWLYGTEKR